MNLLFKGRTLVTGEWVEGPGIAPIGGMTFIICTDDRMHSSYRAVDPASVSIAHQAHTRADMIRSMSDEDLSDIIFKIWGDNKEARFCRELQTCTDKLEHNKEIPDEWCKECLLKWMMEVVK